MAHEGMTALEADDRDPADVVLWGVRGLDDWERALNRPVCPVAWGPAHLAPSAHHNPNEALHYGQ